MTREGTTRSKGGHVMGRISKVCPKKLVFGRVFSCLSLESTLGSPLVNTYQLKFKGTCLLAMRPLSNFTMTKCWIIWVSLVVRK